MTTPAFLDRFARRFTEARRGRATRRILSGLPFEIQKDIGWPSAADHPNDARNAPTLRGRYPRSVA